MSVELPKFSRYLDGQRSHIASQTEYGRRRKLTDEERKNKRKTEAIYLSESYVATLFKEIGLQLSEISSSKVSLSVTDVETAPLDRPIDLKLIWDVVEGRSEKRGKGSDQGTGYEVSWKELNASVMRNSRGAVDGFSFNRNESTISSNIFKRSILPAVDEAASTPLWKKEFTLGYSPVSMYRREIPLD